VRLGRVAVVWRPAEFAFCAASLAGAVKHSLTQEEGRALRPDTKVIKPAG